MKTEKLKEKVKEIYKALKEVFPNPYNPKRPPLEEAVFTILSQNTTDKNALKCLENLKRLTEGELLKLKETDQKEIVKAIRPCGMFNQKLRAIKEIVENWRWLESRLRELPESEAIELLKSFPYIGAKSARVILTFGFGKNTFPIDTHCKRVLKRLGIFPENWKSEEISKFMEENFNGDFNRELHYNLIRLGREICKARKPLCQRCPLKNFCKYYKEKERTTPSPP
ncbi:endonuclease III domain-containing protein [Thermovibrio sp.]